MYLFEILPAVSLGRSQDFFFCLESGRPACGVILGVASYDDG